MKKALTALTGAVCLAAATATSFAGGFVEVSAAGAIIGKVAANERPSYLDAPSPGYIIYSGHAGALPDQTCYWTRMPIYDSDHNVIGWRGRPLPVCP
jgi:nucleoside phosphorylase